MPLYSNGCTGFYQGPMDFEAGDFGLRPYHPLYPCAMDKAHFQVNVLLGEIYKHELSGSFYIILPADGSGRMFGVCREHIEIREGV